MKLLKELRKAQQEQGDMLELQSWQDYDESSTATKVQDYIHFEGSRIQLAEFEDQKLEVQWLEWKAKLVSFFQF